MLNLDLIVGFQWNVGNAEKSDLKHDVLPSESEEIFFNDPLLLNHDAKHSLALGITHERRLLTIVFTLRENNTLIRIISARDQHRKERLVYAKAN
jgi:uncharacterized DUF497 family protein